MELHPSKADLVRRLLVDAQRLQPHGGTLELTEDEARYLRRVLRLKGGDCLELRDGRLGGYAATILPNGALRYESRSELPLPSGPRVHLAFAPMKGRRLELLLEKATEIGAASFQPLLTERTIRRDVADSSRWQRVIRSAARQCAAAIEPEVHSPQPLTSFLQTAQEMDLTLVAHPSSETSLLDAIPRRAIDTVCVLTGPEGGFTDTEVNEIQDAGFLGVHLGSQILRAETAPLVALTLLRYVVR